MENYKITDFRAEAQVVELIAAVLDISHEHAMLKVLMYAEQAHKMYAEKMLKKIKKGLRTPIRSKVKIPLSDKFSIKFRYYTYQNNSLHVSCAIDNKFQVIDLRNEKLYQAAVKEALAIEFDEVYLRESV
jgi:hypothetical protein